MHDRDVLFEDLTADTDAELAVAGDLPASLDGTFFAVGGTGNRVGSTRLHAFDAHGRVTAVRIRDGAAHLRARMVRTPLYEAEQNSDGIVKRRLFTNKPSRWSNLFDVDLGNNAWHNVVPWGDQLVVTNDPGFFLLDRDSLETRGRTPIRPRKGASFTPMPRRDPRTGHVVLFEARPGRRDTVIVREIDDAFATVKEHTYTLPRGGMLLHDVTFTERYYAVVQAASLSVLAILWGARPPGEAFRFDPASTPTLFLLPRDGGEAITVPLPGGRLHFHFWNAFDVPGGDGQIALDAVGYGGMVGFEALFPPEVRAALGRAVKPTPPPGSFRYLIDPAARTATDEPLTEAPAEAPEIRGDRRGGPYRYGWAPTRGGAGDEEDEGAYAWFHALARHDFEDRSVQVWDAGPRAYVSAAAFAPRPGSSDEDDGWVLAWIQDAQERRATLGVFDAARIGDGPVARLGAPGLVGMISHVAFG